LEQFNILIVCTPGVPFYYAYTGMARVLGAALKRLGHPTRLVGNEIVHDATNIVVGAHNLDPALAETLPASTIVYNTEMVLSHSPFLSTLKAFVARLETWDYSAANVRAWRELGISDRVRWLRPGYVPECTTIDLARETDIDVLFYGHVNRRRREILDALARRDIRAYVLMNTYGDARDAYIARAKLVLNIHATPDAVFEIARASHVMSNHRAFVSEAGGFDASDRDLASGIAIGEASELPELCRSLLDDDARRERLAERGYELFSQRDFLATVRDALAQRER
jgi:hypothetical protein